LGRGPVDWAQSPLRRCSVEGVDWGGFIPEAAPEALQRLRERAAKSHELDADFRQTNSESQLIDWIQEACARAVAIIINPAGFSFTSIAVLDALQMCAAPVIEVHLSNIHRCESFRHHSYVSLAAKGVICGLGAHGYVLAVLHLASIL
jgi:3-dehydroquinate dehydratase-2